jgi:hypothetical protein
MSTNNITVKVNPAQLQVTIERMTFHAGNVTSTGFELDYQLISDKGVAVFRGKIANLPIADLDTVNAQPVDPAKINQILANAGVTVQVAADQSSMMSTADKNNLRRKQQMEKSAANVKQQQAARAAKAAQPAQPASEAPHA